MEAHKQNNYTAYPPIVNTDQNDRPFFTYVLQRHIRGDFFYGKIVIRGFCLVPISDWKELRN